MLKFPRRFTLFKFRRRFRNFRVFLYESPFSGPFRMIASQQLTINHNGRMPHGWWFFSNIYVCMYPLSAVAGLYCTLCWRAIAALNLSFVIIWLSESFRKFSQAPFSDLPIHTCNVNTFCTMNLCALCWFLWCVDVKYIN